jgi:hypothetical protein
MNVRLNKYGLLALVFLCGPVVAQPIMVEKLHPGEGCRVTAQTIAQAVAPVTPAPQEPQDFIDGLQPEPILKAWIGDCCPGNNAANCPTASGWRVRCGSPQCETGEYSCLYY